MKNSIPVLCAVALILYSCNSQEQKEKTSKDKYENSKLSLEEVEKKSPLRFLSVTGNDKKNLLGQTVVKGKVTNHAKMVTYKDVDIKLFFYSKTGTLLQEDQEVIYEVVAPGSTVSFKSKYFSPKGTDSIAMKIVSAKY
jgi:hypothetical protein